MTDVARGRESFEKRAREMKRQARAASKRERREERAAEGDQPGVDEDALMARFGELSALRAAGAIDAATFERERLAIFTELGLAVPDDE